MEKKDLNKIKKNYEEIHKKIGFWIFLISLIVFIGFYLFIWMF